eukprot:c27608_g1_i1 orf=196-1026(+)
MGKGPGLFSDIGKKAKDLLTKDYNYDQKFSITSCTSIGLAFTTTAIKKGEPFLGDVSAKFRNKNVTTEFKVDTSSNVIGTVTVDEAAPGLKSVMNFTIPDQRSGKVELQYIHDYTGVSSSIGLTPSPIVDFSGVVGTSELAAGGEVGFDTAKGLFTKYNAGLIFSKPDFTSALMLTDKGDTVKASYVHTLNPLTNSTVGAEMSHSFSRNENTFTVGGLYMLDPLTTVKARLNNRGMLAGLIQHEWRPKSVVTISGEVDSRALDQSAKLGFSLALSP